MSGPVQIGAATLHLGDVREVLRSLPDESVHCCVTSPPYWGLRSYLQEGDPKKALELGSERTPEEFVAHMVEVFREVRRVLRPDGGLWLNLGDCYATGAGKVGACPGGGEQGTRWAGQHPSRGESTRGLRNGRHTGKHTAMTAIGPMTQANRLPVPGLKPKDLVMIPARVAMALQADGWWLRSQCPWVKRNPMPDSTTDRPGSGVEYMFLLSKSAHYFYDTEAVKVPAVADHPACNKNGYQRAERISGSLGSGAKVVEHYDKRNRRNNDWFFESWQGLYSEAPTDPLAFVVNPSGFADAHFATFPPKLVEPCILAGTSEHGCCPACGAPWEREVERTFKPQGDVAEEASMGFCSSAPRMPLANGWQGTPRGTTSTRTLGWRATCDCPAAAPVPCAVLDPFGGAGTTALVAERLGRRSVSIELNPEYLAMQERRLRVATAQGSLFAPRRAL